MEKKYLIGYLYGREALMWDDVKDFQETVDPETNITTITFTENDIPYTYTGTERRGYTEVNNKAPFMTDYKLMGRRTAKRHDYFDKERISADEMERRRAEVNRRASEYNPEDDENEDDYDSYTSCTPYGGCAPISYHSCAPTRSYSYCGFHC